MRITVVLAVGMDSWQLTAERSMWNTAGYFFVPATSIRDAMNDFKAGDFDLVLLGHLLSAEDKERLTRSIQPAAAARKGLDRRPSRQLRLFCGCYVEEQFRRLVDEYERVAGRVDESSTAANHRLQRCKLNKNRRGWRKFFKRQSPAVPFANGTAGGVCGVRVREFFTGADPRGARLQHDMTPLAEARIALQELCAVMIAVIEVLLPAQCCMAISNLATQKKARRRKGGSPQDLTQSRKCYEAILSSSCSARNQSCSAYPS